MGRSNRKIETITKLEVSQCVVLGLLNKKGQDVWGI
jgi:hypothetical protein